jgi:hypothetical protein
MADISDLKDVPGQVTTTVNTQALLTWLRFGTTEPPTPATLPLRLLRKQGRLKTPQRPPLSVVPSPPSRPDSSSPERR